MKTKILLTIELATVALLGCLAIVIPVSLDPEKLVRLENYESPFLPIMGVAVEMMSSYSLLYLTLIGFLAGIVFRAPAWLLGLSTMALFPIWSIIDAFMGGSHNLLPFEWIIYLFLSLFGILGSISGRFVRHKCVYFTNKYDRSSNTNINN